MTPRNEERHAACDVAVIGGGPAGTAAAILLASRGRRVVLVEREPFPRFKIGESMLPNSTRLLRELGVWDEITRAGFVRKLAAEFTDPSRSTRYRNVFAAGRQAGLDGTYQVDRATFDTILRDRATATGAAVWQPCKVESMRRDAEGFDLVTSSAEGTRTLRASWVVDATGREAWLGRQLRLPRERFPYPSRFAVFTHYEGADRPSGDEGGDIIITRLEQGWFWWIPLSGGKTSVGVVAGMDAMPGRKEDLDAYLDRRIAESPWIARALAKANRCEPVRSVADYSYTHGEYAGDRWLMAGDAAGFVDPIFSSGVYLALESGVLAASTIDRHLDTGAVLDARTRRRYTRAVSGRMRVMRRLIESFYDDRCWAVFMNGHMAPGIASAVNSIVAGQTDPSWSIRWRYLAFLALCRLNRWFGFIRLEKREEPAPASHPHPSLAP